MKRGTPHFGPLTIFRWMACLAAVLHAGSLGASEHSAEAVRQVVEEAYAMFKDLDEGKNADYIPALAEVPSDLFGIVVVTAKGEVIAVGDADYRFSIQSCSKVFTLCLAMDELGADEVLEKVNVEPTGLEFNSLIAVEMGDGRADNPFVNAGAIAMVSLLKASSAAERWTKILECYEGFAGESLNVIENVCESELATNFRNRGIAHVLSNSGHLYADPLESTEVYTRQCSVGVTCKQLAMMGAPLANDGVHPVTGKRCMEAAHVSKVLSVMMMNGFYDGSGRWAWQAGLPAKTGVGGGIIAVVPGRMSIATFAPRLDANGNSVRGQNAIRYLSEQLDLNVFGDPE